MSLSEDDVRKIAFLARVRVPDAALAGLARELNNIIGWVEQLNEIDTEDTAPMTSVADMTLPKRDDAVTDGAKAGDVLANAPEARTEGGDPSAGGFFVVPKVVE